MPIRQLKTPSRQKKANQKRMTSPPPPASTQKEKAGSTSSLDQSAKSSNEKGERKAKFLTGSTMSHIITMTLTSAIGLIAIFSVDFVDFFFLSQLEDTAIQAALGFTGTLLFATTSVGIGFAIASSATVARAVGEENFEKANRLVIHSLIYTGLVSALIGLCLFFSLTNILSLLGAKGHVLELARSYLQILVPTMPILAVSMAAGACLRALGDPMQSLYIYVGGALINAGLDPLLIFTFNLGMDGAAIASAIARIGMLFMGGVGLLIIHKIKTRPNLTKLKQDLAPFSYIALPAILTNIASPIGNGYVTYAIAPFGNAAVASWAIIARILPLTFAGIFSLSGAVGPIIGQNLGGKRYDRVQQTLYDAVKFSTIYVLFAWAILALAAPTICGIMELKGEAAEYVMFYCYWLIPGFGMIGYMFTANAAFNNLGKAHYSTWLNWTRATLGTVPFVIVGTYYFGVYGLLSGQIIGGALTAFLSLYICQRLIKKLQMKN